MSELSQEPAVDAEEPEDQPELSSLGRPYCGAVPTSHWVEFGCIHMLAMTGDDQYASNYPFDREALPQLPEEFEYREWPEEELTTAFGDAKPLLVAYEDGLAETPSTNMVLEALLSAAHIPYEAREWEITGEGPPSWFGTDYYTPDCDGAKAKISALVTRLNEGFDRLKQSATGTS